MSLWDTVTNIGSTVLDPLDLSGYRSGKKQDDYYSQLQNSQNQYQSAITQGIGEGREKSKSIYGSDTIDNLGKDISGIISKRKDLLQGEDPSIGLMKRSAAKQQSKAQAGMAQAGIKGAYAQKALGEMNASNQSQIAAQKYKTDQANLNAYQSLLGNIAAASTATELGYGQLRGAGIQTPTAPTNKGLLGSIFG